MKCQVNDMKSDSYLLYATLRGARAAGLMYLTAWMIYTLTKSPSLGNACALGFWMLVCVPIVRKSIFAKKGVCERQL